MTTRIKFLRLLFTIVALATAFPWRAGHPPPVYADELPPPLPAECGGSTGPGGACCVYGYVYYEGAPVDGADVHIDSPHGSLDTPTMEGRASSQPYYAADLTSEPLLVSTGDVITITVSYDDMVSARTWTVQSGGQQVDLGLIADYQAPGPVSASAATLAPSWEPPTASLPSAISPQDATIRYVDGTNGNDGSNDCTDSGSPCRTVQHAVDQADSGDVIKVATGTYTGVQGRSAPAGYNGPDTVYQVVYIDKTLTIQGGYASDFVGLPDPETNPTTLDAERQGRVIFISGAVSPTVEGLRITGGDADGLGGYHYWAWGTRDSGGGVYIIGATAIISDNQLFSNTANIGGGLFLWWSDATLGGNTVFSNTAAYCGGGLGLINSDATLNGNTVTTNTAEFGGGLYMCMYSDATLNGNNVSSNSADYGGGLYICWYSNATLNGNTVSSNTAEYDGGGLVLESSDAVLDNNFITDNHLSSGHGSGLYVNASSPHLRHNTIARNLGGGEEGLYVTGTEPSQTRLYNTILVGHGVGIHVDGNSSAQLEGTLWGSGLWANPIDWSGNVTTTGNVWGDPDFVDYTAGDYHINAGSAAVDTGVYIFLDDDVDGDPRPMAFGPDIGADEHRGPGLQLHTSAWQNARNPGQTVTYTLVVTGVGTGPVSDVILTDTLPLEQRVIASAASVGDCATAATPVWGGGITCALGTLNVGDSAHITLTAQVTTTLPSTLPRRMRNRVWVTGTQASNFAYTDVYLQDCHVRLNDGPGEWEDVQTAVNASTRPADVVKVAGVCTGINTRGDARQIVYLDKTVTIRGGYSYSPANWTTPDPVANPTTLDAQGRGRVIYITGNIHPTVEGLHITGGDADGLGGYNDPWGGNFDAGGGMYILNAAAIISSNQVFSNTANTGGGLYLRWSDATLSGNTITANAAARGGGLFLDRSAATLNGNTVSSNTADAGGGLYLWWYSDAILNGNIITANTADYGGGLHLDGAAATLSNNTVFSNTADHGGGLHLYDSAAVLSGNTVTANTADYGGGLFLDDSDATLINNVVADNRVEAAGSGLYIAGSFPHLLHTTIAHNSGGDGSGVHVTYRYVYPLTYHSSVIMTNTIVATHTVGVCVTAGSTATLESTLWHGNTTNWGCAGTISHSNDHTGDPAFVDPDAGDYHIRPESAAIDAGVDAGVAEDIDGNSRPLDAGYDIGADEFTDLKAEFNALPLSSPAPITVTFTDLSTGDIIAWDWTFGDGGLSGARHPAHTYENAGIYTVSLTVSGPGGSDSETKSDYITTSFLPSATIDAITPNPAFQGQDTVIFNGSGQDNDEGGAFIVAYDWRSDLDGWLSDLEDFGVTASELSAGAHTITFQVQDDEGDWSQGATRTLTVVPEQTDRRTLILVNRQKLETLYSASEAISVTDKLNALAAHEDVEGLVVQVEDDAAVADAYAAWDADPTSTAKANAVTAAIKDVVDAQWAANPDLEYLVIVGDDRVVPFRRVLDQTRYPESRYRLVSAASTVGAALRDNMTLTDDYYADAAPTVPDSPDWDGHELYIPDLGTGRLIETPDEIVVQVDAFLGNDEIATDNAIVTGYDFVTDGAQAICDEMVADGVTTDCTLIGENWDRDDFISEVLNARHDVASINGHANHYVIGTPSGHVSSTDVAAAAADHKRAILYTVGCHSGLNVPPTNPYQPLDTAQALVQHRANYVANTGYGWGYRFSIGLSERLMLDFTERLAYGQSATVGQALATAKQEYYLNEGDFDYYDEKILIESTLYGLPMYRYATPAIEIRDQEEMVVKEEQLTVLGDGLTVNSLAYQFPTLLAESTGDGLYYTFGGLTHAGNGEPIQPMYVAGLSFPTTKAHGVVFKGGTYVDMISFDPVVDVAITETNTLAEPAFSAPGWYPSQLHRLNRLERGDRLVTLLGQFNPQTQTERVYDRLSFDVYYHTTSSDWTAPSITSVGCEQVADGAAITVKANDASGIEAVVVAHTDGSGTWASTSLTASEGKWQGSLSAGPGTEFFVQVVDKAGNVAVDDNGGGYFTFYTIYLPIVLRNH